MIFSSLFDLGLIIPLLGLLGISLSLIASTTSDLLINQLVYFIIGIFLYIFFAGIDYSIWKKLSKIFYFGSLILLLITFLWSPVRGSHRWIDIGFTRIQPSEIIKPFMTLVLANIITARKDSYLKSFFITLLIYLPIVLLIFRQPDLGNVIVYLVAFLAMVFISGLPLIYFISGGLIFGLLLPIFWSVLKDYQKLRIISFLNPQNDPSGAGYNALQAIIAIGAGQFLGMGLGKGTQSHLLFLPEYHTDFVFASLGEELGFIGGALVIIFCFILLSRILYSAYKTTDNFGRLICVGVFAQLFIQVFINIGMNLGLMPITGITLPFVSYGGSSILSSFISLGLVVSINNYSHKIRPIVIK